MPELAIVDIERCQLCRERGSLSTAARHFIDRPVQGIVRSRTGQHKAGLFADYRKEMAELVGYAARDTADGFHFLRLSQLSFKAFSFRLLLPDRPIGLEQVTFEPFDTDLQLLPRRLERALGLLEFLDALEQSRFPLPSTPIVSSACRRRSPSPEGRACPTDVRPKSTLFGQCLGTGRLRSPHRARARN